MVLVFFLILSPIHASNEKPSVVFDETGPYYNFFTIFNLGGTGSSIFANLLESNGFSVSRLTGSPITDQNLQEHDVLIVMAPARNYTDDEIQSIKKFVNDGGGLFLLGDNWGVEDGNENYAYNLLAQSFGLSFSYNEALVDSENYIGLHDFVIISDIQSSSLTTNLDKLNYMQGSYIKDPGSSEIQALSSSNSWGDQLTLTDSGFSEPDFNKDPNEVSGPLPVLTTLDYGQGRVVFFGSVRSFNNAWIYRSDNWKLGINSVNWLAGRPAPSTYEEAGLFSPTLADLQNYIMGFFGYSLLLISALVFKINKDKKDKKSKPFKIIKNWKYNALMALNAIFIILVIIIFISSNMIFFDIANHQLFDVNLGYTLLITGIPLIFFSSLILYNIYARLRIKVNFNYFSIFILILFTGLTAFLGNLFSFPIMGIFTGLSLFLILPFAVNLWINHKYGSEIIIEGKEFNRLEKLSLKSLPYELQSIYQESSFIGEGGFGRVFKAQRNDGQDVAIKIPKSFDKRSEKIFVSEVANWENLIHPHIVRLYDYKILPIPYLEMEYCESSLSYGPKTVEESVSVIYEVAQGLKYAHGKNIIHGDIKNTNIMSCNGIYKISDWGLSKLHLDESVTVSGVTPHYAAPEQISREFGKADRRTDIYQLGIIFYEQLTGNLPFKGEISKVYDSILNTQPVFPSVINPDAALADKIVMKCLSKNKKERYNSMDELLQDLEPFYKPRSTSDKTVFLDKEVD